MGGAITAPHGPPLVYDAVNTRGLLEVVAVRLCHGGEEGGEGEARVAIPFVLTCTAHHRQLILVTRLTLCRAGRQNVKLPEVLLYTD